jgi:hypothetical protein
LPIRRTYPTHKADFTELCIDNVVYLLGSKVNRGYMSVKMTPESTVVTCSALNQAITCPIEHVAVVNESNEIMCMKTAPID